MRSTAAELVLAIQEDPASWVDELSGGLLLYGLSKPSPMAPLHVSKQPAVESILHHAATSPTASNADLLSDNATPDHASLHGMVIEASEAELMLQRAAIQGWQQCKSSTGQAAT